MTPSPTPIGGGAGKLLFQGTIGNYPNCRMNIYEYDLRQDKITLILEDFIPISVSPDGKHLLVFEYTAGQPTFNPRSPYPLYIVDIDGSNLNLFSTEFNYGYGKASWLTGTDLIVFTQKENGVIKLLLSNPDGTIKQIAQTTRTAMTFIETPFKGGIIWRDGDFDGNGSVRMYYQYYWSGLNGEDKVTLPKNLQNIKVSPNGEYFAYQSTGDSEIYITGELDGSDSVELCLEDQIEDLSSDSQYDWSDYLWFPDGHWLFCSIASCSFDNYFESFVLDEVIFSFNGELITKFHQDWSWPGGDALERCLWSPDGRLILVPNYYESSSVEWTILDLETMDTVYIVPDLNSEEVDLYGIRYWLP
jgi:hypothetical protein